MDIEILIILLQLEQIGIIPECFGSESKKNNLKNGVEHSLFFFYKLSFNIIKIYLNLFLYRK